MSTSLSEMLNEKPVESSSVPTDPMIFERVILTFAARITMSQRIVFASITVSFSVIVHGPV